MPRPWAVDFSPRVLIAALITFRLDRNLSPPRGNNIKGLPKSITESGAVATALNERIS